nr:DNA polymerase Y family protein [Sphingomonas vulcanisoli]
MVVFTDRIANAVRLTALSPAAVAKGLTPNLTLADARARFPELVAIERDHAAEADLLARIVAGLARYTPMATSQPRDGAMLDISGCAHPFGDERGLARDLAGRLKAGGVTARLGLGDTPEMARARARFGALEGDILALPVEALEADAATTTALRRAGLKTIADLACRPRRMLAARFGDLALRLGRLLGEEDRRITPERALPPIFALRRFAEPIGRVEDALACLEDLLGQAAVSLLDRHAGGRRFIARLFRSDGAVPLLSVETGRPVRDPAIVMRLFRERLEALSDPIDPGFGFDCVRLDVPATEPLAPAQTGLEETRDPAEPLAQLIDRLAARLGPHSIRRAVPLNSHLPECAAMLAPPGEPGAWRRPTDPDPPARPLRLLDPPARVDVTYGLPMGPPRRFVWKGQAHEVARWEGPERIAAEWWRRSIAADIWRRRDAEDHNLPLPPGAGGLTRDYYRVEDADGHRFWLFRHGLQAEKGRPGWYLHGLFA